MQLLLQTNQSRLPYDDAGCSDNHVDVPNLTMEKDSISTRESHESAGPNIICVYITISISKQQAIEQDWWNSLECCYQLT